MIKWRGSKRSQADKILEYFPSVIDMYYEPFVGGGEIYKSLLPEIDKVYVTKIDGKFKADTYFPNLDKSDEWEITDESEIHNENGFDFKYVTYERTDNLEEK